MTSARLETFSDGVIAIIITIMVLELKVPYLGNSDEAYDSLDRLRDAGLVETVRKATPRGVAVTHSPDLDHIADKLPTLKPGVLVVDTASTADLVQALTWSATMDVVLIRAVFERTLALAVTWNIARSIR